jgi:hypothetical protein
MSNDNNTALTVALGAGAGLGLWYLLRDDETTDDGGATEAAPAPPPPPCSLRLDAKGLTADGTPIDIPAAVTKCQAAGRADLVIADDAPSTVSADLAAAFNAAGILVNQRRNGRAPRRRARRRAGRAGYTRDGRTILRDGQPVLHLERVDLGDQRFAVTPHEADVLAQRVVDLLNTAGRARRQSAAPATHAANTHRIFLFRSMPKNGNSRTRWYEANPPTSWEDAKRRIVAAGLLDERIMLPTEWSLVTDLPPQIRVPADRLRPLP